MTRVVPLPFEEWSEEARDTLPSYLRRPELYRGPDARPMPTVLGLLAHQLPLADSWLAFNEVLADETTLDIRMRELIVLRVAWRTRAAYEWSQHTRIALQAGLSTEELHAIPDGADATLWTPLERAVLAATDQIVDDHAVDADTWAELAEEFSDAELLELLFVAGAYLCFAVVTNSVDLQPDPAAERVDAPALPGLGA